MWETRVQSLGREDSPWRRKWQPTPVLLPGKFHGWSSLGGYSPWGRNELDTTEWLHFLLFRFLEPSPPGPNDNCISTTFELHYPWHSYFQICLLPKFPCDPKINTCGAFTVCRHAQSSKNSTLPMPMFLERDILCLCVPALRLKTNLLFIIDLLPHFFNCCTFCCFHCFKWQAYSWSVFYVPEHEKAAMCLTKLGKIWCKVNTSDELHSSPSYNAVGCEFNVHEPIHMK